MVGAIDSEIDRTDQFFSEREVGEGGDQFFWRSGVVSIFFENCRVASRSFQIIFSYRSGYFPESPVRDADFSGNHRIGPEDPGCVVGISWGLSPPHPHER